ncbi:nucleoside recognition domain-containing protein [Methyloprofundus sp.]|uniref:nucleoside recognition domain-containing protein n=1 Tax=Methyloprofundus sp. TaxID=2020875 RepID=UPI003D0A9BB0
MNVIFLAIILIAFFTSAYHQLTWIPSVSDDIAPMQALTTALIEASKSSVELAIGLVGVMAFFLGLMKVAEAGGLLQIIARLLRPLMVRLFPEVPEDHPAMGAMIMNMSANALGLGNAATPFGIRAMQELDKLNPVKGTASNAMVLFLAINTSSVTLLPTGIIALRASAGSADPAGIIPTTLFATLCSTTAAILAAKFYQRFFKIDAQNASDINPQDQDGTHHEVAEALPEAASVAYPAWASYLSLLCIVGFVPLAIIYGRSIGPWIIPVFVVSLLSFGAYQGVRIYEVFVEGAKDGFNVAIKIIPYLIAILVAIAMFRESGAMQIMITAVGSATSLVGFPAEALPMALLRPLSGSGAYGVVAATLQDPAIGPDSYVGYLVSTLQGSTETTFYVLAVYFGAVQIRNVRHALAAGLTADLVGIIAATAACYYLYA